MSYRKPSVLAAVASSSSAAFRTRGCSLLTNMYLSGKRVEKRFVVERGIDIRLFYAVAAEGGGIQNNLSSVDAGAQLFDSRAPPLDPARRIVLVCARRSQRTDNICAAVKCVVIGFDYLGMRRQTRLYKCCGWEIFPSSRGSFPKRCRQWNSRTF